MKFLLVILLALPFLTGCYTLNEQIVGCYDAHDTNELYACRGYNDTKYIACAEGGKVLVVSEQMCRKIEGKEINCTPYYKEEKQ